MQAPRRLQLRRGNTAAVSTYLGAAGELIVNTDTNTLIVHDGSTVGGIPATTNTAAITSNVSALQSNVATLTANAGAQAGQIAALTSNAAVQAGLIADLTANAGVQAGAIVTANTAMKGYVDGQISSVNSAWQANAGAQAGSIATLTSNAAVQAGLIATLQSDVNTLTANAGAQAGSIATLTSNAAAQAGQISDLQSNAATQAGLLASLNFYNDSNVATYLGDHTAKTFGGNVSIQGNLFVNGNISYVNTNSYVVSDNIVQFADSNPNDSLDLGFVAHRTVGGILQHTGLVRDASDGRWKLFSNVVPQVGSTVDFTNAVYDELVLGNISSPTITNITANLGAVSGSLATLTANAAVQAGLIADLQSNAAVQAGLIANAQGNYSNANVASYLAAGTVVIGNLTIPGNILFSGGSTYSDNTFISPTSNGALNKYEWKFSDQAIGNDTITLQWNLLDTTLSQWYLSTNSQTQNFVFDGESQSLGFVGNSGSSGTVTFGATTNNGTGGTNDIELTSATGNAYIRTGSNSWKFNQGGNLTFPDSTVQTTAWTGTVDYTNVTNTPAVYGNSNVGSYLTTYTGNIGNVLTTANVVTTQYFIGNGALLTGIVASAGTTYSNTNVAAYLSTANITTTGNITAAWLSGNISITGNVVGTSPNVTIQAGSYSSTFNNQGNVILPNVAVTGNVISGGYFLGNGALLTGIVSGGASTYSNTNVAAYLTTGLNGTAPQIQLTNATSNFIKYNNVGVGAPTFTTSNVGTRIIYWSSVDANTADYAVGIDAGVLWHGIPRATSGFAFKWYAGTTQIASLEGTGNLAVSGNVSATYFVGNGALLTGIVSGGGTTYSNANVASYLPTYSGNIANLTVTNTLRLTATKIALGYLSGLGGAGQGTNSVAVGSYSGYNTQGNSAVAIGVNAGMTQGDDTVAIGSNAGGSQTTQAVAVGFGAGQSSQSMGGVAVGYASGQSAQGLRAVAIGSVAGNDHQGAQSIAIGHNSGYSYQPANSIELNATGTALDYTNLTAGLYITSVKQDTANVTNVMYYNTTTKEITYGAASGGSYGNIQVASYLPTYSGNIGNVTTTANITTSQFFIGNGSQITGISGYSNANVTSYLPTHSGNVGVNNIIGTTPNVTLQANSYSSTFDIYGNVAFGNTTHPVQTFASGNISTAGNVVAYGTAGITMPNRPAFRINGVNPGGQSTADVNLKGSAITTVYNQGNHFNATTGIFTAPVAGIYEVLLNARVNSSYNSLAQIVVLKNGLNSGGNVIAFWETTSNIGGATHFGVSGTVVLAAGEYLSANILAGNITFDQNDNWSVTYLG